MLDAEGDAAALGKRARKDAARNKATLVGALGLEGARRELARLVNKAKEAAERPELGAAGDGLRATAGFVPARKRCGERPKRGGPPLPPPRRTIRAAHDIAG